MKARLDPKQLTASVMRSCLSVIATRWADWESHYGRVSRFSLDSSR
jgi:hypothetical protein